MPGDVYGRLTIVERCKEKGANNNAKFLCRCECGNTCIVYGNNLKRLHTKSCGCFLVQNCGDKFRKHGMGYTKECGIWHSMIQRCTDPSCVAYKYYGGRGIKVCDRWLNSFETFYEDMGPRPTSRHSIDRWPDNDGDYEPSNCRWATWAEQARNRRSNRWFEHNGERLILSEWAKRLGLKHGILTTMLKTRTISEIILKRENNKTNG